MAGPLQLIQKFQYKTSHVIKMMNAHREGIHNTFFQGPFCLEISHQCIDYGDGWNFVGLVSFDKYERPYQRMKKQQ